MIFYTPSQWYSERYGFTTSSSERYCRKMDVEKTSFAVDEIENFRMLFNVELTLLYGRWKNIMCLLRTNISSSLGLRRVIWKFGEK